MEWYDPEAITTADGSLVITMSKKETHDLDYQGGMLSTWNKFCFTGGIFEASVSLPGYNNILGLWPAVWAVSVCSCGENRSSPPYRWAILDVRAMVRRLTAW